MLPELRKVRALAWRRLSAWKLSVQRRIESAPLEAGFRILLSRVEDSDPCGLFGSVGSSAEKKEIVKILEGIKEIRRLKMI